MAGRALSSVVALALVASSGAPVGAETRLPGVTQARAIDRAAWALSDRQIEELGLPDAFLPFLHVDARVRTGRSLYGQPAPDLDGNAKPEVLESDLRYSYAIGEGNPQALPSVDSEVKTKITVRTGTDGKKIWSKRYDRDAYPFPMRVGDDGRRGVVVISGIWGFYGTRETNTLRFDAYVGRTGRRLWSREYTSVSYYDYLNYVTADGLIMLARFDGLEGPAQDLMLGFATQVAPLWASTTTATRVVVLDGADGAEHVHPIVDVGIDWWPIPWPTRDLDGDGLDDYATTNRLGFDLGEGQETPSFGGTVYARRGSDGRPIWTTSGLEMAIFAFAGGLPDVAGDGTPEVGMETYVERSTPLLPVDVPLLAFRYVPRVYLLEGSRGLERWHDRSEWLLSVGDIDRSGKDDLMLGSYRIRFSHNRTNLELRAVDGAHKKLWSRDSPWTYEAAPCPRGFCIGSFGYWLDSTPDLQPDGVRDTFFSQDVQQDGAFDDSITRLFHGRTGEMVFQDDGDIQPVDVAIDGRGTDLVAYKPKDGKMRVEARDGHNRTLWAGMLGGPKEILPRRSFFWATGIELPGDDCGDLVINGGEENDSFYGVFNGGDGRLIWWRWTGERSRHPTFTDRSDHNPHC